MRGGMYGNLQGPGPGGQPPLTLDGYSFTTTDGKQAIAKDAFGYRLYDTIRVASGTVIPTSEFLFFQIALGAQTAGLNFATQYAKTLADTNIKASGQIQKGRLFRVISMQIRIIETGATDTTYGSSGAGTQMPTNPAGAAVVSAANEEKAICEASFYTFKIDDRDYEQGKAVHFPSPYGFSGFAGSGAPGGSGAGTDSIAIINNGFGRFYQFPVIRNIDGLRQFSVAGQFAYGITPNRNFNIECCLEGLLYRSIV
jgi:hypothetical protein